jgi:hypothetical protein
MAMIKGNVRWKYLGILGDYYKYFFTFDLIKYHVYGTYTPKKG